jgi:hypothetical protein
MFDTRDAAERFGAQLERLRGQDVAPSAVLEKAVLKSQAGRLVAALPSA